MESNAEPGGGLLGARLDAPSRARVSGVRPAAVAGVQVNAIAGVGALAGARERGVCCTSM